MRSHYRFDRRDIADRLLDLVAELHVLNHPASTPMAALTLYNDHNIGFDDAIIAARSLLREDLGVSSFDRSLDRVPGMQRRKPS